MVEAAKQPDGAAAASSKAVKEVVKKLIDDL